LVRLSP